VTDEVVVGHKQDAVGDQTKRKKVMAGRPKDQGSRPPKELQDEDASDKPFVELGAGCRDEASVRCSSRL
jgi:hypothetical protein